MIHVIIKIHTFVCREERETRLIMKKSHATALEVRIGN